MSAPFVELDTPLGDLAVVCRCCLVDSGVMKDIREWELMEDFRKYAGIQIRQSDGVSELICSACEDTMNKCKQFEEQCKKSDILLKNFATNKIKNTQNENTITYTFNEKQLIFTIEASDFDKNIKLPCPYNCKATYIKKNDLLTHLVRVHEHKKDYGIASHYHCPHPDCPYNKIAENGKYFHERKYFTQHFNRVHKTKVFHCDKCDVRFSTDTELNRHHSTCSIVFLCEGCDKGYRSRDRLLVHLLRHHPDKHKQFIEAKKAEKRKSTVEFINKKSKIKITHPVESLSETDNPKRSFATQTLDKTSIKNDVALPSWQNNNTEISTQTGFEDLLSLKSNSEDSLFYSETTLSDIQTQTFPLEFGLFVNRSHKETLTETIDMSIKGTQTCLCYCETPKLNFGMLDSASVTLSPRSGNVTSTETQTADFGSSLTDVLSTETQTCFDEAFKDSL